MKLNVETLQMVCVLSASQRKYVLAEGQRTGALDVSSHKSAPRKSTIHADSPSRQPLEQVIPRMTRIGPCRDPSGSSFCLSRVKNDPSTGAPAGLLGRARADRQTRCATLSMPSTLSFCCAFFVSCLVVFGQAKEQQEQLAEARLRFVAAVKANYQDNFRKGWLSDSGLRVLMVRSPLCAVVVGSPD